MDKMTPAKLSKRIETDLISLLALVKKHGIDVYKVSFSYEPKEENPFFVLLHWNWSDGPIAFSYDLSADIYTALYNAMRQANPEIPPF